MAHTISLDGPLSSPAPVAASDAASHSGSQRPERGSRISGTDEAALVDVERELDDLGAERMSITQNLAEPGAAARVHSAVVDTFGPIDVLVNNAAIGAAAESCAHRRLRRSTLGPHTPGQPHGALPADQGRAPLDARGGLGSRDQHRLDQREGAAVARFRLHREQARTARPDLVGGPRDRRNGCHRERRGVPDRSQPGRQTADWSSRWSAPDDRSTTSLLESAHSAGGWSPTRSHRSCCSSPATGPRRSPVESFNVDAGIVMS